MDTRSAGYSSAGARTSQVALGRALTTVGWIIRIPALLLVIGPFLVPSPELATMLGMGRVETTIALFPIKVGIGVVGAAAFWLSHGILIAGKRRRSQVITSFSGLAGTRYVLYLRPFTMDSAMKNPPSEGILYGLPAPGIGLTTEAHLVSQFQHLGRVVAVGQPGEPQPLVGADRGYPRPDRWQDAVRELIRGAHAVVLFASPSEGTTWEYIEALRSISSPSRLVLLVQDNQTYNDFRTSVGRAHADRADSPPLPHLPAIEPRPGGNAEVPQFPIIGVVTFDDTCRAQFTWVSYSAAAKSNSLARQRRVLRDTVDPFLQHLPPVSPG